MESLGEGKGRNNPFYNHLGAPASLLVSVISPYHGTGLFCRLLHRFRDAFLRSQQDIREALLERYEMKDLGELQWFLGIRAIRDCDKCKLWPCQYSYVEKITNKYNLQDPQALSNTNADRHVAATYYGMGPK